MTGNRWLAVAAGAYSLLHHQGSWLADAGETVDRSRWADWIDLATPYLVLLPVALALHALAADRLAWGCYLVLAGLFGSRGKVMHNDLLLLWTAVPFLQAGPVLWTTVKK